MKELGTFGELVKLKAFVAFASAEEALANINDISEGTLPPSPRTCPRAAARCQPTRLHTRYMLRRLLAKACRLAGVVGKERH